MSTYCVEHELLTRAVKESERAHVLEDVAVADAPLTADTALTAAARDPATP